MKFRSNQNNFTAIYTRNLKPVTLKLFAFFILLLRRSWSFFKMHLRYLTDNLESIVKMKYHLLGSPQKIFQQLSFWAEILQILLAREGECSTQDPKSTLRLDRPDSNQNMQHWIVSCLGKCLNQVNIYWELLINSNIQMEVDYIIAI